MTGIRTNEGDIIVTTPKGEMEEAAREAEEVIANGGGFYWHSISGRPKRSHPGNRVFYVEDGYIRGFALIVAFESGFINPTYASAVSVVSDAKSWKWIRPSAMQGFQGFRYADFEFEVIGGWLDPKPELNAQ